MSITPTVGRKLYYIPNETDLTNPVAMQVLVKEGVADPLDATIIAVHDENTINVLVIDIFGQFFPKTNVALYGDMVPVKGGYAVWMPYQLGLNSSSGDASDSADEIGGAAVGSGLSELPAADLEATEEAEVTADIPPPSDQTSEEAAQ